MSLFYAIFKKYFSNWMFCSVGIPIWEHTLLNDKGLTKLPCFICIKSKVNFVELGTPELPI